MPSNQLSQTATIPAPVLGWNARDPLSAMKPGHAVILRNFIPGTGGVSLRKGYQVYATGAGAAVETLMEYSAPSGGEKLFAAAGTHIYDVTSGGAVGASVVTTTSARWQHVMFGTPGGNYLVCCNGVDSVRNYNGSTWSTPSITGPTSADLINVAVHQSRLWFVKKNSLSVFYLAAASISGAATEIDFSDQFRMGGSLVAMASWTRDGGAGSDDVAVFISSKGEVLTYTGTDPASADTWVKNGLFKIPEPVGRRCVIKGGGDLGVITSQGVISLSSVLSMATAQQGKSAATDSIKGAFNTAYKASGQLFGWQMIEYPKGGLMLVNVPTQSGATSVQYVMNAMTGAWCEFDNLNAICWSLLGDDLYFGRADGSVCLFDTGYLDNASPIQGVVLPAFSNFKTSVKKRFLMAKPLYTAALGIDPPLVMKLDYDTSAESLQQSSTPPSGEQWDVAMWDVASWGSPIVSVSEWQGVEGVGNVGSVYLGVSSENELTLQFIDIIFEAGGLF